MAFPNYTPPQLAANPYQIAGQAATQLGGQIQEFGENRDKMRMAYDEMVAKRKEKILADQRQQEDFALKKNADERAAADAQQKADAAKAREAFLKDFTGADPDDPANQAKLRSAFVAGIIDKPTYDAYQPPKPERFSAGGGYYEMGDNGQPRTIIAPKPDAPTETSWTAVEREDGVYQVNPKTGESRKVGGLPGKGATAPAEVDAKAQDAINVIEQMVGVGEPGKPGYKPPHPGFSGAVGLKGKEQLFGALGQPMAGTEEANFLALYNQITGKAFLEAFQSLKGGGHITEIEGVKATQAITRMNTAQSESEFIKAANEFKEIVKKGAENAKRRSSGTTKPPNTLSPLDQQALDWANANPNDPRSQAIKQRLGQ